MSTHKKNDADWAHYIKYCTVPVYWCFQNQIWKSYTALQITAVPYLKVGQRSKKNLQKPFKNHVN
jgi:hypothetical protein